MIETQASAMWPEKQRKSLQGKKSAMGMQKEANMRYTESFLVNGFNFTLEFQFVSRPRASICLLVFFLSYLYILLINSSLFLYLI